MSRPSKFTIMLWLGACVSDLVLLAVILIVLRAGPGLGILALVCLALWAFSKAGGFENWRPSRVREYLKNARRMGL